MNDNILEMKNITKDFPGVRALDDVSIVLERGTILGLVGENGAGKSTLVKILSGAYAEGTFTGTIMIDGEEVSFHNERDAEAAGIAIIYQELMLFPDLSIAENIALPTFGRLVNAEEMYANAQKWMEMVSLDENPATLVRHLGVGKRQLVEIAKALSLNAQILVLDEPSAALTDTDTEHLLGLLEILREQGVSCIYISHKLEEVMHICDNVTVIRDGQGITTQATEELNEDSIIQYMVGREIEDRFPEKVPVRHEGVALRVEDINLYSFEDRGRALLKDISFELKKGEILGIAGLMGAGRTELVNSIFGDFQGHFSGKIFVDEEEVNISEPYDAIKCGIGLLTEDRKATGLNLIGSVENNIGIVSLSRFTKMGVVQEHELGKATSDFANKTRVLTPNMETEVMNLSGGNQQKVVIAKWLMERPKILIFDEPTRGIDVGAKQEIYLLMNELKEDGVSIIMVSSELPEILGMSDRVLVLNEGRVTGVFDAVDATQERIMENLV